jgi:acyl-CoA thioesterase-1
MNSRRLTLLKAIPFISLLLISSPGTHSMAHADTILFLGDSLTAGYHIAPEAAYPSILEPKIEQEVPGIRVVNAGVSGDTSAGGLRRLDWLMQQRIRVLVLALGANDGLRGLPVSESRSNLSAIVKKARARYPDVKVVLAGMLIPPNMGEKYTNEFRAIFPELAEELTLDLIPFLLEGVAARPELNIADGIHPNEAGHRIVAENVWRALEPVLKQIEATDE